MKKLKKETKNMWLEALRSGKYKQGQGCLKKRNRHCCLGVLAEEQGLIPNRTSLELKLYSYLGVKCENTALVLEQHCPAAFTKQGDLGSVEAELAYRNDRWESFSDIAAWIEEHL